MTQATDHATAPEAPPAAATIDLKWGLPIVLPFAVAAYLRGFFWAMGIPLGAEGVEAVAAVSLFLGCFGGAVWVASLAAERTEWPLRIGRRAGQKPAGGRPDTGSRTGGWLR